MKTVIFDFDGVIHSYVSGWKGALVIPDPPVEGIKELFTELRKEFKIAVVSSRCAYEGGIDAIKEYLAKWGIEVDEVRADKPAAMVTVDDRAICFDGNPVALLRKIRNFKTWQEPVPLNGYTKAEIFKSIMDSGHIDVINVENHNTVTIHMNDRLVQLTLDDVLVNSKRGIS